MNWCCPPNTHHVELQFDAIEVSSPDKVRLQYRLDEVDPEWLDATTPGRATYSDIPHGTHAFHMRACNRDGVWDRAGVAFVITQQPHIYQTAWFQLSMITAGLILLAGFYRWRVNEATSRVTGRLEARLGERERIARELHDTLLQGFQGLILHFQAAHDQIPAHEPVQRTIKIALGHADQVLIEGRERVRELRSEGVQANELSHQLALFGEELARDRAITFKVTVVGAPRTLHSVTLDEIYQIAREALSNAFRHSQASAIEVEIYYDNATFRLRIRDNGSGIDQEILGGGRKGHWGLSGMRERAQKIGGQLNVWSNSGAGTEIDLKLSAKAAYTRSAKLSLWSRIMRARNRGEKNVNLAKD